MTNLEKVTADIRNKIPRLMELTEGCVFETGKYTEKIVFIDTNDDLIQCIDIAKGFGDSNWRYRQEIYDKFTIIGHPVMLNDVLDWLNDHSICSDGSLRKREHFDLFTRLKANSGRIGQPLWWNLSKPYLRDQSNELIDYLAGLI